MFLFLLFLHLYFLNAINEPMRKCVNCKFYLKPIGPFSSEFSKCILYTKYNLSIKELEEKKKKDFIELLVNGYEKKTKYFEIDYHYCSYARESENMCGKEGKKFKKK